MHGAIDAAIVRSLSGSAVQPSGFQRYQGEVVSAALVHTLLCEMKKLFHLGAIYFPFPPGWRGALHAGSLTWLRRFTIE
jgi:hypothetical protein